MQKLPKIAIIGRPNVGKSCLFNRLAKQKIAITSNISGTTRDTNYTQICLLNPAQKDGNQKYNIHKNTSQKNIPQKENTQNQKLDSMQSQNPKQNLDSTQNLANALLIDTGGIEPKIQDELFLQVSQRAKDTSKEADLVLYVVDGQNPPNDEDKKIIYEILKKKKKNTPCFLVVNKIDSDAQNDGAYLFYEFGLQEVFFISVAHNRGISALQNAIFNALFLKNTHKNPHNSALMMDDYELISSLEKSANIHNNAIKDTKSSVQEAQDFSQNNNQDNVVENNKTSQTPQNSEIKIGIIGRVNVGKSSLLNALTQKERAIVSKKAGTTIDPVDESIAHKGTKLTFVDTAGIRKRGKIEQLEKFALDRTNKILAQSDIALLVLDASERLCELDERIFSLTQKHALGVIVLWNKWDIKYADFDSIKAEFERKFRFLEYAPRLTISAKNKRHITELKDKILEIYQNFSLRIPTAKLNEIITRATQNHAIPSDKGKLVKIYYATQFQSKPPQIALISNRPNSIHFSYKRYLINCLRDCFSLSGVPILLHFRDKNAQHNEDFALESVFDKSKTKSDSHKKPKSSKNAKHAFNKTFSIKSKTKPKTKSHKKKI
ncbi:ribosome biogenesis GTPase Der [Helicobacter sp. T3_23-1056]